MKKYKAPLTPKQITTASLEALIDLWEATETAPLTPELAVVRGWLMDELERRNPSGFNAWLEQDAPEDIDLRKYIFRFPILNKDNARVGQYYAWGGGYQIVCRIYRIGEEYARENELMYLDRVETTAGDFALPGSDIFRG